MADLWPVVKPLSETEIEQLKIMAEYEGSGMERLTTRLLEIEDHWNDLSDFFHTARYLELRRLFEWFEHFIKNNDREESWEEFCEVEGIDPLGGDDDDPCIQMMHTGVSEYYQEIEKVKGEGDA